MSDRFPDIEIYIKRPALADIVGWLDRRFGVRDTRRQGETLICSLGDAGAECFIVENAVKGGFTSVWFRSGDTPWPSDRDCALEASAAFGLEVRCSTGTWQEEDDDSTGWIRITPAGESNINWL